MSTDIDEALLREDEREFLRLLRAATPGPWRDFAIETLLTRLAAERAEKAEASATRSDNMEDLSCPTCAVVDAAVAFCASQHSDGKHLFSREAYNALVAAVTARERWAASRTCRRCTTCEDYEHHWVEDPQPNVITDWACQHCPARGVECPVCDGDEDEAVDCDVCGGAMVVRAEPLAAGPGRGGGHG